MGIRVLMCSLSVFLYTLSASLSTVDADCSDWSSSSPNATAAKNCLADSVGCFLCHQKANGNDYYFCYYKAHESCAAIRQNRQHCVDLVCSDAPPSPPAAPPTPTPTQPTEASFSPARGATFALIGLFGVAGLGGLVWFLVRRRRLATHDEAMVPLVTVARV
eukprot:TRINITY_DN940_c0_g1_i1.p1 TRINITY_DN940_c0_g1~~TRINITY_DN940_c0_g1_i1.p1  ORF type:complete len:162 (+),score=14.65 TRINITY_DN940_c0_g1_i1:113-598(+)